MGDHPDPEEHVVKTILATEKVVMQSFFNDPTRLCSAAVFSDADFALDTPSTMSTTGGYIAIMGPNTWARMAGICKSQHAVGCSLLTKC